MGQVSSVSSGSGGLHNVLLPFHSVIFQHVIKVIPADTIQSIYGSETGCADAIVKIISVIDAYDYFSRKWEGLSTEKAFSKGLEVFQIVVDLAGKGASFVQGLGGLKLVATKVAIVAGTTGTFIGVGASAIQVGVDSLRAYQITRELFQEKIDLKTKGRISFQTLTGAKRSDFQAKKETPELYAHIRTRLKTQLALRTVAIGAGATSIAATLIFALAPTPVAPLAWALLALGAILGSGAFIASFAIGRRLDKALAHLPAAEKVNDAALGVFAKAEQATS